MSRAIFKDYATRNVEIKKKIRMENCVLRPKKDWKMHPLLIRNQIALLNIIFE